MPVVFGDILTKLEEQKADLLSQLANPHRIGINDKLRTTFLQKRTGRRAAPNQRGTSALAAPEASPLCACSLKDLCFRSQG
jgi:hypothetical protein